MNNNSKKYKLKKYKNIRKKIMNPNKLNLLMNQVV